jgi:hypothetical protein
VAGAVKTDKKYIPSENPMVSDREDGLGKLKGFAGRKMRYTACAICLCSTQENLVEKA